jgi:hypothetical protein
VPAPDLFQKILDAYYEAEFADPPNQAAKTLFLEALIDEAIAGTPYSRSWFVEAMGRNYREYRHKRKKKEGIPRKLIEGQAPDVSN